MGATDQDSLHTDDLPPGPAGWETYLARALSARLDALQDPDADLPGPSPLEELVSDVLTALYGPPDVDSVPERFKGTPEAVEALRRQRERDARGKRRAALDRLARRFPHPVHRARWRHLREPATRELTRRDEEEDARTPWWIRPDAPREALRRAVFLALADSRVQGATVEELEGRLRSALQDAYASDVAGPAWASSSASAEHRQRRESAEQRVAASESLRLTAAPAREAELRIELERRRAAVEARAEELTEAQRAVYLLVERDGLTPAEAAEELDLSASAARERLKRARRALAS